MNHSRPLAVVLFALYALLCACNKNTTVIRNLDDAKRAKIGVMTGTTGEALTKARYPEAQVKSFDDIMDAVAALKSAQCEAIVTSYPTAVQVSKKNRELAPLSEPLDNEDTSIALRKGNEDLLAKLNQIISELKSDGTFKSMKKRWFKPDLSPYEELNIVLPTEGTPLRVGVSATREPFSFVDKDGRVTGHDGELARLVAFKLHRPVEFSNMKFMALIPALQSGKVDLIITGMTATKERSLAVAFTEPYFVNSQVMLVKKPEGPAGGSPKMVSTADITDKRIGVFLGSVHSAYATRHYPHARVSEYRTVADISLAVKTGHVDVALYDEEPLREILRENPEFGLLGESLFSFTVGAGFNKSPTELRESFNGFLEKIKKDGVYQGMVERWIMNRETRMPDLPHPQPTNGTLVVGVSLGEAPFGFVVNGETVGFDIELVRRFGAYLGKEVQFADMEFGGLIAAVASKKVDMIAASMFITDERKKQIDFSDPYYEMGNRAFALKSNIAAYDTETSSSSSHSILASLANSFRSNIIQENRYLLIWDGLKTTIVISVFSTVFGTLLGAIICFLRMSKVAALRGIAKFYIGILRGTPVVVLLMLIFYVVFASVNINPLLVAVIAFGMNFAAYVSEIFRTGIEGIDKGQTEAGIAMGFSRLQTFLYVVLPQTVQRILPVYKGEFISLVKMTSIVGYIAVQDLTKASDIIRSRTFDAFFPLLMVAALYFAISWVLMQSLDRLERVTDPKYKRRKLGLA
jgi:polar amino acid transport system substrate-binding protein